MLLREVKVQPGMEAAYEDWKAPNTDQGVLLWPGRAEILANARQNHSSLLKAVHPVQGLPLGELRRRMREYLGHADHDQLLIADGHQTELYHPGVWIKLAAINLIAHQLNATAIHFAVDSDAPKHLDLRWPGGSESILERPASGADWTALLMTASAEQLRDLYAKLQKTADQWPFDSMVFDFLRLLRPEADLPQSLTDAMAELDHGLGLSHRTVLTAPLWFCSPYLIFTHHILARADSFARNYNGALSEYRRIERIDSPGRPMPDLELNHENIEVPFWLDDLHLGRRQRLHVQRNRAGQLAINISGDTFVLDTRKNGDAGAEALRTFCQTHHVRLAPRALSLTMFLRLLVCDQWIHGIGGGRYDRVTDAIIQSFFEMPAPKFAVATATLYFPTAADRSRTCLSCVKHEGHQLKHRLLGVGKNEYLEQIADAPRRSPRRNEIFAEMHRRLTEIQSAGGLARWEHQWTKARKNAREDREIFDRELFYALQPRDRLEQLMHRLRAIA